MLETRGSGGEGEMTETRMGQQGSRRDNGDEEEVIGTGRGWWGLEKDSGDKEEPKEPRGMMGTRR